MYVCMYVYIYIYTHTYTRITIYNDKHNDNNNTHNHTTTPHNQILPDCFTPPNAKVEHGSASTSVLLSLG